MDGRHRATTHVFRGEKEVNGFSVGELLEGLGDDVEEPGLEPLFDDFFEKVEVLGAVLEDESRAELEVILRESHVVLQSSEADLGLNHPELGKVAGGV